MSVKRLLLSQMKSGGVPLGIRMATGSYIGDGAATQAIVGVGFQPEFLMLYAQANGNAIGTVSKSDVDGFGASFYWNTAPAPPAGTYYEDDQIISLNADGFTVGDGTGSAFGNTSNINLTTYTYIAFGGAGSSSINIATYTGDGAATQAIVGVGFQPKWVLIWKQTGILFDIIQKTDQDGVNARIWVTSMNCYYQSDQIISLDADGFTVGDGTPFPWGNEANLMGQIYTYVAMR